MILQVDGFDILDLGVEGINPIQSMYLKNLYQQAKKAGIPFIIGERGITEPVCSRGVL